MFSHFSVFLSQPRSFLHPSPHRDLPLRCGFRKNPVFNHSFLPLSPPVKCVFRLNRPEGVPSAPFLFPVLWGPGPQFPLPAPFLPGQVRSPPGSRAEVGERFFLRRLPRSLFPPLSISFSFDEFSRPRGFPGSQLAVRTESAC